MIIIFFIGISLIIVLGVERLTRIIIRYVFFKHSQEIDRQERKLSEYHELSLLALVSKNKAAYDGLQEMTRELYWRLFFRKLMVNSSTFFLLLSPYMLFSHYIFKDYLKNPFGYVFMTAIFYFLSKTMVMYFRNVFYSRKQSMHIK